MTVVVHKDLVQGTDEWLAIRRGILTASEMKKIITPTLKIANNDDTRAHVWEIAAQRISGFVEPTYEGFEMMRGEMEETLARDKYAETYAPVDQVGFITNNKWGFTIGYSPDGLVGDEGLIEIKSRRQRFQIETIIEGAVPKGFMMQLQTGLLVSGRKWIDFISYSGGLHMMAVRVYPDEKIQSAIIEAATNFEAAVASKIEAYNAAILDESIRTVPTERVIVEEFYA